MKEYYGGDKVQKGVYLDKETGELVQLYEDVRILPGRENIKYVKVPGAVAALGGPLAGLAFVFFLPLIGIVGVLGFLAMKAGRGVVGLVRKPAYERGGAAAREKGAEAQKP